MLPRDLVYDLLYFLHNDNYRYIAFISGLSMTGKTTLIYHMINELNDYEKEKTALIILKRNTRWNNLINQINILKNN